MKEAYKALLELEDFYKDMKKKYPILTGMFDKLIKMLDHKKSDVLNGWSM